MNHRDAFELLPLYSLDALESDDRAAIDNHLAGCRICLRELARYATVAEALSGEMEPSQRVWTKILERIDSA